MSGKALEGKAETRRFENRAEWNNISNEVTALLRTNRQTRSIVGSLYRTNVLTGRDLTHGDIDFVIGESTLEAYEATDEKIAAALGSSAHVRNGNVSSFEFKGYQIDFIKVPEETTHLNAYVLGHGGAGHLLRYLGRPYNLQLQLDGLKYRLQDGDRFIENVSVTANKDSAFNILGLYSYYGSESFHYGFPTLEAAYRCVADSTLFTLSAFDIDENFEYVGNLERLEYPVFAGFITWIKEEGLRRRQNSLRPFSAEPTAAQLLHVKKALNHVAGFSYNCKQAFERYTTNRLLRSKFSGEVVMVATGLAPGSELGRFMEAYKKSVGSRGKFEFFILSSGLDTIQESIQAFYETWKNRGETERVVETLQDPNLNTYAATEELLPSKKQTSYYLGDLTPIEIRSPNPYGVVRTTGT